MLEGYSLSRPSNSIYLNSVDSLAGLLRKSFVQTASTLFGSSLSFIMWFGVCFCLVLEMAVCEISDSSPIGRGWSGAMPAGHVQASIDVRQHTGDTETEDITAGQGKHEKLHLRLPFELCAVRSLSCSMSLRLHQTTCGINLCGWSRVPCRFERVSRTVGRRMSIRL